MENTNLTNETVETAAENIEAVVEETPAAEAPVEEAPAAEAPVEETPAAEAPVEETPAAEAPVEEAPAAETPVEEAPAAAAPADEFAAPTYATAESSVVTGADIKEKTPKDKKKGKGWKIGLGIGGGLVGLIVIGLLALYFVAMGMCSSGSYDAAKGLASPVSFLPPFKTVMNACDYGTAGELAAEGKYAEAYAVYSSISGYMDADAKADESNYNYAYQLIGEDEYDAALEIFTALGDYEGAAEGINECNYLKAIALYEEGEYEDAQEMFEDLGDYEDAEDWAIECIVGVGVELYRDGDYGDAADIFYEYYEVNERADAYYGLCVFQIYKEDGTSMAMTRAIYDILEPYADEYEDVEEALEDPFFFIIRFFSIGWESGDAYLDADIEAKIIYHSGLFWERPQGNDLWYMDTDDGLYFFIGEEIWFIITGFDSYDELHPEKMYVTGSDGKTYIFEQYDVINEDM